MYKYLTWSDGTYFEGQSLYSRAQCNNLLRSLSNTKKEVYATIQDYNQDGTCIGSPIYFDIDSSSLYDAWETARELKSLADDEFDCDSFVWFSGGKGFHILSPLYVRHPRCHEIISTIIEDMFKHLDLDLSVYRNRSMLRVDNTWNIKGNNYKVACDNWNQLSLSNIINSASRPAVSDWKQRWKPIDLDITEYIERLPAFKPSDVTSSLNFNDMMPCLKNLWMAAEPPEGKRHELAYVFVRHCYRSELSQEETASLFESHVFWGKVRANDYLKIIRSVYTRGQGGMGCNTNALLQDNCVIACKYNKEFDLSKHLLRSNK